MSPVAQSSCTRLLVCAGRSFVQKASRASCHSNNKQALRYRNQEPFKSFKYCYLAHICANFEYEPDRWAAVFDLALVRILFSLTVLYILERKITIHRTLRKPSQLEIIVSVVVFDPVPSHKYLFNTLKIAFVIHSGLKTSNENLSIYSVMWK